MARKKLTKKQLAAKVAKISCNHPLDLVIRIGERNKDFSDILFCRLCTQILPHDPMEKI